MLTQVNFNVKSAWYGNSATYDTVVGIGDFPDYHGVNSIVSNQYSGTTKLLGVPYKRKSLADMTNSKGDTHCPKCQKLDKLVFVDEMVQMGFIFNKYFEFVICTNCDAHYCIVMVRKDDRHD